MADGFKGETTADAIRRHPELSSRKLAELLGCTENYVAVIRWRDKNRARFRATQRNGWRQRLEALS